MASKAVLGFPPFANLDHQRVISGILGVYKCTKEAAADVVFLHPRFAGLNHQRVMKAIRETYTCTEEQASKAVLAFPQFAGYDHKRVIRQLGRISRMINIQENELKELILQTPVFGSYSAKRYLATIDVVRHLDTKVLTNKMLFRAWKSNSTKSPYVPDTQRLRITEALRRGLYTNEPQLMTALRKNFNNTKERLMSAT